MCGFGVVNEMFLKPRLCFAAQIPVLPSRAAARPCPMVVRKRKAGRVPPPRLLQGQRGELLAASWHTSHWPASAWGLGQVLESPDTNTFPRKLRQTRRDLAAAWNGLSLIAAGRGN